MRVDSRHTLLFFPAHAIYWAPFSLLLWYTIESRARCVPDGLAALPGFRVPVFAVSASSLPMSAGQDAATAFGQHSARFAAQPRQLVVRG
jgi:hypothetical protein